MWRRALCRICPAPICALIFIPAIFFLRELPQIRINEQSAEQLLPYAKLLNMDFIWVHAAATGLEATLAYSLNQIGVPTLVVEMGVGMRINQQNGQQLVDGILNLMKRMGIWNGPVRAPRRPIISSDGHVSFINAEQAGIFIAAGRIFGPCT